MLGAMKAVMKSDTGRLGIGVKRVLYEKVIVPTITYGSEFWGMKTNERQKLNVFEIKFLRNMAGVSRLDRLRNEEVRKRKGVRKEFEAKVDMNV